MSDTLPRPNGHTIWVYLIKSEDKTPIYIGQSKNIPNRFKTHKLRFGQQISIRILEAFESHEAADLGEGRWYRRFSRRYKLANKNTNFVSWGRHPSLGPNSPAPKYLEYFGVLMGFEKHR